MNDWAHWRARKERFDFWSCYPDSDQLYWTDPDEAIRECLANMGYLGNEPLQPKLDAGLLPLTVKVYGWRRKETDIRDFHVLDSLMDDLDEEYGGGDDPVEVTPAMEEAEKAFMAVMKKEYVPWQCERVHEETINVLEWIKGNAQ
jgi:hypothetical protein